MKMIAQRMTALVPLAASAAMPIFAIASEAPSEAKLRRFINISATYFDLPPFGDPAWGNNTIESRFLFSFLPKIKELEMAKDMPPVHAIPTIVLNHKLTGNESWSLRSSSSFGAIIPGSEKLIGVKSTPRQWLMNLGLTSEWSLTNVDLYASAQAQYVRTRVSGIEKPFPSNIETESEVGFASLGARSKEIPFWGAFSIGRKKTFIKIYTQGQTLLDTNDTLQDAPFPAILEGAMGWYQKDWGIHAGIGEVFIPERLYMPRIFVGILHEFER
jgi:hypothetical protein